MSFLLHNARIVSPGDPVIPRGDVLIEGDRIVAVAPSIQLIRPPDTVIDARGRVLMPGFVDCHTHACFAGSRLDEWDLRRRGATYLEILAAGGGIMSTVRAVRAASQSQLADLLRQRLDVMLRGGTTTVEIKSGYGLTLEHELKMLRAIDDAASTWPGTVVKTALLGHAVDPDIPDFFNATIGRTLDAVHAEFPGIAVDVFCEKGAWPVDQARRLLARAVEHGHPVRAHVDQFNSLGFLPIAIALGARSVDHLEATTAADIGVIAAARDRTVAVGLPVCGFHVDGRYANLRAITDAGGRAAIATNLNPGSAPSSSMPFAVALAVRHCGLVVDESIDACTRTAAAVLGLDDRGVIKPGARADLVLLDHDDERSLACDVGGNPAAAVICGGTLIGAA
ncbi:MAG: imidazolonepropionase [Phycisphaerae bacterium]